MYDEGIRYNLTKQTTKQIMIALYTLTPLDDKIKNKK